MLAPLHWLTPKPCETCSDAKWPNVDSLLLKLWSIRTTCSARFVGELFPPINVGLPFASTAFGCGKSPAPNNVEAFGEIMHDGMVLFGKGCPCTIPAGNTPPGQFPARTLAATLLAPGTLIGVVPKLPP